MASIHQYPARVCQTAGGFLVHENQVLLIKHKKLGIWLAPGGHVEPGELFHQTAEREVFEETGIKVEVVSAQPIIASNTNEYLPLPILICLHWISKENYQARINSQHPDQPHATALWPKGCEQHLGYIYLVKAVGAIDIKHDSNEIDDIGWFDATDLENLDTNEDIKSEIQLVLNLASTICKI